MARLKEIKERYPYLSKSLIDILADLDISKTNKYIPVFLNVLENNVKNQINILESDTYELQYYKDEISSLLNINTKDMSIKEITQLYLQTRIINYFYNSDEISAITNFMKSNENKQISVDLGEIKSISDIQRLNSLAAFKVNEKINSKAVKVLHQDDEWLVVQPITFESSLKYGANTKWCTTYKRDPGVFFEYTSTGVLIYFINYKTGDKYAVYISLKNNGREISFWTALDDRIDSMFIGFPPHIIDVIKNVESIPNRMLDKELWEKSFKTHVNYIDEPMGQVEYGTREHELPNVEPIQNITLSRVEE